MSQQHLSVRVLVVGDAGAGKTCAVSYLSSGIPVSSFPEWTVGCEVTIKEHKFSRGTGADIPCIIEFIDVGGHKKHDLSRSVFYNNLNGIILVFDMSNLKSFKNLRKWIRELVHADHSKPDGISEKVVGRPGFRTFGSEGGTGASGSTGSGSGGGSGSGAGAGAGVGATGGGGMSGIRVRRGLTGEASASTRAAATGLGKLPVLVIGTKSDATSLKQRELLGKMVGLDLPTISMSATRGSVSDLPTLHGFFDDVIEQRHHPRESLSHSSGKGVGGGGGSSSRQRLSDGRAALFGSHIE